MPCALCLQDVELKKSHIIPEFLNKTIYDDKHRLQMLSVIPKQPNWRAQKGLREKLLCAKCELRFSVWERYASLVLEGGIEFTYTREENILHISNLDYMKFKLFQLSILWRAGVSSLQFFENVKLGKHAEVLRKLLLTDNPGQPERYGCLMFGLKYNQQAFTGIIMQPSKVRIPGHAAYKFIFGGVMWVMIVSNHDADLLLRNCTLSASGKTVLLVREATDMQNLARFSHELSRMGRVPR